MPIKKAAKKSLRQSKKRTAKNLVLKVEIKKLLKQARKAIEKKDAKAEELARLAIKKLDKIAQRGPFHKNKAGRLKSRLMQKFNKAKKSS